MGLLQIGDYSIRVKSNSTGSVGAARLWFLTYAAHLFCSTFVDSGSLGGYFASCVLRLVISVEQGLYPFQLTVIRAIRTKCNFLDFDID